MDQAELTKIVDLLWERKQIILYGPPGTGKTYLASKLARHLTDDGAVKLVQFHPSYTYEDFFEGFRPEPGESGTLTFTLRAGPFRDFAEVATDNPSTAYILIIDEINRANLAKVFGELYFLLEYRDESISLQYSPDNEFTLPENLFLIGTMNTADRSIARIDTAMRRRFKFVELDPRIPPVQGLLSRWLEEHELPPDAALLLDELNARIEDSDPDAAIGPSYLMDERIYQRDDGLDRVWQYSIMPLLEDLFFGQRDLEEHYGLASLRKAIAAAARRTVNSDRARRAGSRRSSCRSRRSRAGRWPDPTSSPRYHPRTAPDSGRSAPARKVGAARVGDIEIHIRPKVGIARLLFLAGYSEHGAAWRPEAVPVDEAADLVPAFAQALWRQTERAIHQGLLPGYILVEESSQVLRGRLRESEQLHRHHGLPLPAGNPPRRVHRRHSRRTGSCGPPASACSPSPRGPRVPAHASAAAPRFRRRHAAVPRRSGPRMAGNQAQRPLPHGSAASRACPARNVCRARTRRRGRQRLPARHAQAVRGLRHRGPTRGARPGVRRAGGRSGPEPLRRGGAGAAPARHRLEDPRGTVAVIDAKYKAEKPAGYPNADLYQLLAYCTVLGLRNGHLAYAKGNEVPACHIVRSSGIEIAAMPLIWPRT